QGPAERGAEPRPAEVTPMPLQIIRGFYFLSVHLLFASGVCLVAWLLTSLRGGSATGKHWIWVATALNFGLPVAALVDALWGPHFSWATPLPAIGSVVAVAFGDLRVAGVLCGIWSLGAALMLLLLGSRLRAERHALGPPRPRGGF